MAALTLASGRLDPSSHSHSQPPGQCSDLPNGFKLVVTLVLILNSQPGNVWNRKCPGYWARQGKARRHPFPHRPVVFPDKDKLRGIYPKPYLT